MPKRHFTDQLGGPCPVKDAPLGSGAVHMVILSASGWDKPKNNDWNKGQFCMASRCQPLVVCRVRNRPDIEIRTPHSKQTADVFAHQTLWNYYGTIFWMPSETLEFDLIDETTGEVLIGRAKVPHNKVVPGEHVLPLKNSDGSPMADAELKVHIILTPNMNLHPQELVFMVRGASGLHNIYGDVFGGSRSCPFVKYKFAKFNKDKGMEGCTTTEQSTSDPEWNQPAVFKGFHLEDTLEFEVWHDKEHTLEIDGWDGGVPGDHDSGKDAGKPADDAESAAPAEEDAAAASGAPARGKQAATAAAAAGKAAAAPATAASGKSAAATATGDAKSSSDTSDNSTEAGMYFEDILLGRGSVPATALQPGELTIKLSDVPRKDKRMWTEVGRPPPGEESFLYVKVFVIPKILDTYHRAQLRSPSSPLKTLRESPPDTSPDVAAVPQPDGASCLSPNFPQGSPLEASPLDTTLDLRYRRHGSPPPWQLDATQRARNYPPQDMRAVQLDIALAAQQQQLAAQWQPSFAAQRQPAGQLQQTMDAMQGTPRMPPPVLEDASLGYSGRDCTAAVPPTATQPVGSSEATEELVRELARLREENAWLRCNMSPLAASPDVAMARLREENEWLRCNMPPPAASPDVAMARPAPNLSSHPGPTGEELRAQLEMNMLDMKREELRMIQAQGAYLPEPMAQVPPSIAAPAAALSQSPPPMPSPVAALDAALALQSSPVVRTYCPDTYSAWHDAREKFHGKSLKHNVASNKCFNYPWQKTLGHPADRSDLCSALNDLDGVISRLATKRLAAASGPA